jgi:spore coat protein H
MTHDIPKLNLLIKNRHLRRLQNDVWNERLLPSKLVIDHYKFDSGVTYRGDHVRAFTKKSYRVGFKQYNEVFQGNEIHLNAEYRDPSLIRNKLSFDFFHIIGGRAPKAQHVFLELNGKSQGIYLLIESVDRHFLKNRNLPDGPIFYATTNKATFSLFTAENEPKKSLLSGYELKEGKEKDFEDLEQFLITLNTYPREGFGQEIARYVDVQKYLTWLCGIVCTQNFDAFIHNYALYKNRDTGLYEIIPWDYDATWGRDWDGLKMEYDYVPIEGYNTLTARILDVKQYREQYRDMLEEILKTTFTTERLEPIITNLMNQIKPYLPFDPYINRFSNKKLIQERDYILQFIEDRNQYLRDGLKSLT